MRDLSSSACSLWPVACRAVDDAMRFDASSQQRPTRGGRPGILLVPCRWHKLNRRRKHEGSKTRRPSAHKGATSLVPSFPPPRLAASYLEAVSCVLDHETAHGAAVDAAPGYGAPSADLSCCMLLPSSSTTTLRFKWAAEGQLRALLLRLQTIGPRLTSC